MSELVGYGFLAVGIVAALWQAWSFGVEYGVQKILAEVWKRNDGRRSG